MKRIDHLLLTLLLLSLLPGGRAWAQPALDPTNAFITQWQCAENQSLEVPLYGAYSYRWVQLDAEGNPISGTEINDVKTEADAKLKLKATAAGPWQLTAGPSGVTQIKMADADDGAKRALRLLERWGKVEWASMDGAFHSAISIAFAQGVGTPDLSKVTSMNHMFAGCSAFNHPIGDWDVSHVTSMVSMFSSCTSFNQPIGTWDVSHVTSMERMFFQCIAFNQPLASWDVSHVTDMIGMFTSCTSFDQPIGNWNVANVENMAGMLTDCTAFNQPIGGWDVSKVKGMNVILQGCRAFNHPLSDWTLASLQGPLGLEYCGMDVANYSATLSAWAEKSDQLASNIQVKANGLSYNVAAAASRQKLIQDKGWSFASDGQSKAPERIEILNHPAEVLIGAETAFSAKVIPEGAFQQVVWSVEEGEASGATFQGNVLTATREGTITVRAEAVEDPKPFATVQVTVKRIPLTAIALQPSTAELRVGSEQALTVDYTPADATDKRIRWTSSDESVASVDAQGKVTARQAGIATITATAQDGDHTATCAVTVTEEPALIPLTAIALQPTTAELRVGGEQALTVNYTPTDATDKRIRWTSSDESVASVDAQGKVTARQAGIATITATAQDGDHTATCAVTVPEEPTPIPLTAIALQPTTAELRVGGEQALTVNYTPTDATDKRIRWTSSDETVASVDAQGKVTARQAGTATIMATAQDGGHTANCHVTVKADEPAAAESAQLAGLSVRPNPFAAHLIACGAQGVERYELINASGQVVLRGTHDHGDTLSLHTAHLAKGFYWLRLLAADGERVVGVVRE